MPSTTYCYVFGRDGLEVSSVFFVFCDGSIIDEPLFRVATSLV